LSSLVIIVTNLSVIYLRLRESDVMFTSDIKQVTAYLQRVFIPVFRYVKVIKIPRDFPKL